jgi:hypothetical protein
MQGVPTHAGVSHPLPSRRPVVAAIAALLIGGATATAVWWLTDNEVNVLPESEPVTRVIVTQPVEPGAGTAANNEAGVAAAVGGLPVAQPLDRLPRYPTPSPESQNDPGARTD